MNSKTGTKKFQVKDLVVTALLIACSVLLYMVSAILSITPYTMVLVTPVWAILSGITYFLVAVKTKNPYMLFLYTVITGMVNFYIPCVISCLVAGLITLFIMLKKGAENTVALSIGWVLTTIAIGFGGMCIPFIFMASQTIEQYASNFGEEYLKVLTEMMTPWFAVLMLIVTALCALLGSFIAKKMLKKHFEKAGVV